MANFSSLILLTVLGLSYGFPHPSHQGLRRSLTARQAGFGDQQIPPPIQPTPATTPMEETDMNQPSPLESGSSESTSPETPSGVDSQQSPLESGSSSDPQTPSTVGSHQTSRPDSTESEPIEKEPETPIVIIETISEAQRTHIVTKFLCEMCKELDVQMCKRACNGEGEGSGIEEGSGSEESSGSEIESSGEGKGEEEIIIIIADLGEASGQEAEASGEEASGQERGSGSEASGIETESSGSNEAETSGEN